MTSKIRQVSNRFVHLMGPMLIAMFFILMGAVVALILNLQHNSVTGRATLKELLSFSDPNSPQVQKQKQQTAAILAQLHDAEQADIVEALRRMGMLARAQGVPQSTIDKIVSPPFPQPTFGVAPR